MAPRKKQTRPQPTPQPDWQSPRVAQPLDAITPDDKKLNVLERAQAIAGLNAPPEVLAAIIIAQAADRLAEKMIEAAAVGRYRGS
jgi:hypothetical protein